MQNLAKKVGSGVVKEFSSKDLLDFLEHANDLVQSVTPEGRFLYVNRAWKQTLGYCDKEIKSLTIFDIIADDCQNHCKILFSELMSGKRLDRIEIAFKSKDGRLVYVEGSCNCRFENGIPISTRGIFRDITDKKRAEQEKVLLQKKLERAQFFESLGVMAGGIAHDFNNILMSILGHLELLCIRANYNKDVLTIATKIENSALKAAELTRQMLAFSGAGNAFWEVTDLNLLLEEVEPVLQLMLPENLSLRMEIKQELPSVKIDKSHVCQAIVNLFVNSVEAIGENEGVITVRSGIEVVDSKDFFKDAVVVDNLDTGLYCFIEIEDTGPGIESSIVEKIFEPFYSTKFQGRGLGLSAALGIVRGHKGVVKLYSHPGKGTRVSLFFPTRDNLLEDQR